MIAARASTFLNLGLLIFFGLLFAGVLPGTGHALNIHTYSDTLSHSAPGDYSNHTFEFDPQVTISPGGFLEFTWPADFTLMTPTSTFDAKNVEMYVNGVPRVASGTGSANVDTVAITGGAGGVVRYTLNPTTGISAGDTVKLLVGNHTSLSDDAGISVSTTTGTTTILADIEPIQNSTTLGSHEINLVISGGTEPASTDFLVVVIESIGVGPADTTEIVPPFRFNGAPTSTVTGVTQSVEISLETDEFATCRYSTASGTAYSAMVNVFDSTGLIVHTNVLPVLTETTYTFYVRCIDDEGNFNIDDYVISFYVGEEPTGESNPDGEIEGDGSGTGDGGGGDNDDGGGTDSGSASGSGSGGGGGGGGGSGGSGDSGDDEAGGGFESNDDEYPSGDAEVIISGYAFPGETVFALVDGSIADSDVANSSGSYEIIISAIARGAYTFGIYAIDGNDVKSTTFSTSFTVTGGRSSKLSNINIMPSILVEPDPVDIGDPLVFRGYSIPDAEVTIENQKDGSSVSLKTFTTTSDGSGEWSLDVDSSLFSNGTYKVRAKAEQLDGVGIETDFSDYTFYGVGQSADIPLNPDLNRDGSVNLTDFSIMLFWWGSDGGASDPPADINQDGSVSLTDFSIMLFNWTG